MSTVVTGYDQGVLYTATLDDTKPSPVSGVVIGSPRAATVIASHTGDRVLISHPSVNVEVALDSVMGAIAGLVGFTEVVDIQDPPDEYLRMTATSPEADA